MVRAVRFERLPHRRGAAAVELAMLLPVIVFLLLVAVDFARVYYFSLTVTNCARNGALYACDPVAAAVSPFQSVQQPALADAGNLSPSPTVTTQTVGSGAGSYVTVTVNYTFQTITNFPGIPATVALSRSVTMRTV